MCQTLANMMPSYTLAFLVLATTFISVSGNEGPVVINNNNVIIQKEDIPIGTIIGTLTAQDSDGPQELYFSIPPNHATAQLVELKNTRGSSSSVDGRTVDIVLKEKMDRDYSLTNRKLRFIIEDNHGGEGNVIELEMTLYITDVNDEIPVFRENRYEKQVPENQSVGDLVTTVTALDPDNGNGGVVTYTIEPVGQAVSDDYRNAFVIIPDKGEIRVNRKLDASVFNYYEYKLIAMDGGGLSSDRDGDTVLLLIKIEDIQDKPPYFINLPYSISIPETYAIDKTVLQVTALDGDKGVPNNVTYSFASGLTDNFNINSATGWISVKSSLDRDAAAVSQRGGVYAIIVMAREDDTTQDEASITATTLVTITVEDVNDNGPEFSQTDYTGSILENMQAGVPITLDSPTTAIVCKDIDQGENSHFTLTLEKDGQPYNDFAPLPSEIFSESSILIRVVNSTALDHEIITSVSFQIVARETSTTERRSSTANVVLTIVDMNDNNPVFMPTTLPPLMIPEDAAQGIVLVDLNATDSDRGNFGEITYHTRGSNNVFTIDETSGVITLTADLDREQVDTYFVTAEARDGGGLTTFINLDIHVTDVNDKAPVFRREEYYVTVKEDSTTFLRGELTVQATDDDEPSTVNSEVMYRIVSATAGLHTKFYVNASTGVLILREPIDYESLDIAVGGRVLLQVEAYDMGTPSLSTSINVTVEIEDVNDNAPEFDILLYTGIISESAVGGTSVVKVTATDDDSTKPNNEFLYRIDSGAGDKFRINFQTGEITVEIGAKLDREDKASYTLNVSATDRGATSETGQCLVEITVTDVNDEPPQFNATEYTQSVKENAHSGKQVVCASATDNDLNPSLTYTIVPDSVKGYDQNGKLSTSMDIQSYFTLNSTTGCVKVGATLDRETAETIILQVQVQDINAVTGGKTQLDTATVTITLEDVNDNAPQFLPNATYSLRISESLEVDTEILRIETLDKDKGQTITYNIHTDPGTNFNIGPSTGILRLKKQLNREEQASLVITVVAMDNGVENIMSSTATISINVQDINDNNPVFNPYNTEYSVSEDANVDVVIATISADDADLSEFGRVVYTFDVSDSDDKLKIDRSSGAISVTRTLDREIRASYTLYVTAIDNPTNPSNQRTNQTKAITIRVDDVNDNDPVFTNIDVNTRQPVLENLEVGAVVFTVTAEDDDIGDNAKLEYTLTGNATIDKLFEIETVEKQIGGLPKYFGEIKVKESLIGYVGDLKVDVMVTDKGDSPRVVTTSLVMEVEDVNQYPPIFTDPQGPRAIISAKEEEPLGTVIMTLQTKDDDFGDNAKVVYSLEKEGDYTVFTINADSGAISNTQILDRETQEVYELKIRAQDKGVPEPRYSILALKIVLLDVDDKDPEFPAPPSGEKRQAIVIHIREEKILDQTSTNLSLAYDKDSGNNSVICYYIIGGDPQVDTHFSLNQQTGILTLTQALDRESLADPTINMIVFATSSCHDNTITNNLRTAVFPPTDYETNFTILWVKVNITDINDNPPEFKRTVLTLGVTRDTGYGVSILNLQDLITDKDATMKVEVLLLRTEAHLQGKQTTADPFKVFKNGTVATNTYFQSNMYGYFLLYIQAQETVEGGEPFIANATLRISLINDDQRVKVVFKNTPDVVRRFQVEFTQRLQNTTGYRIVIDKIQTHENTAGQPEVNKTDMLIHGEDMKTNETISAAELLRVIDQYAEALLGLRYDYKVLEIVPTVVPTDEEDLENVFKMALILVTIILVLLCVAIAIVFYITTQQYKRKLKAATALAYASSDSGVSVTIEPIHTLTSVQGKVWRQLYNTEVTAGSNSDLQKLEMPGTNVHAYENVNPIYLEKIMLEEAGEQADDDSLDDNAVDTSRPSQYSEQHQSMNFYTEDNNLNKVPQSKLGNGDAILNAALQQHEDNKFTNGVATHQNGGIEGKQDNFSGLPTTEI